MSVATEQHALCCYGTSDCYVSGKLRSVSCRTCISRGTSSFGVRFVHVLFKQPGSGHDQPGCCGRDDGVEAARRSLTCVRRCESSTRSNQRKPVVIRRDPTRPHSGVSTMTSEQLLKINALRSRVCSFSLPSLLARQAARDERSSSMLAGIPRYACDGVPSRAGNPLDRGSTGLSRRSSHVGTRSGSTAYSYRASEELICHARGKTRAASGP